MGKNKKIKKTIKKKVVKKQIKKNQNKKPQEERRMTPDQQSKQLEFLKTALSRPGAQGGGGDPQSSRGRRRSSIQRFNSKGSTIN